MKVKVIIIFLTATMLFSLLTGCNINLELSGNKEEVKTEEINPEVPENEEVKPETPKNEEVKLEIPIKEEVKPEVPKEEVKIDSFNIYTANIDSYKKEIKLNEKVARTLEEDQRMNQLKSIANSLSTNCFSGLPIEVIGIENINGKDIAIINLKESKENEGIVDSQKAKGETWQWQYMQGSAGGIITTISLEETILQREYTGKWIDGVEFLYNNNKIIQQHAVKLENIIYR